uniref:Prokineticin 1 n=1 Tax=Eptatretus burgeri TaxID=7764 RepID=A0A8C4QLN3_EPTBU
MRTLLFLLVILCIFSLVTQGVVITGACEMDDQCGTRTCCAASLWLPGLRMCTPLGLHGDECHPYSHKAPFMGKRKHHTCPCAPTLMCARLANRKYQCTSNFKNLAGFYAA